MFLCLFRASESSQQRQGARRAEKTGRRRRPNLREGPNGCVLRVEVETSDSFALSMIPSPSRPWFSCDWGCASAASVSAFPYCTRGTCASSLVWSHTSRSPSARHLRACPVREVVTVTWDPRPREPVEGVLRATSVLELAATRWTLELRGKRWLGQWRVSRLQSTRGESSQQRQGARRAEETGRESWSP
ncbi:hypothetical protein Taro_051777 [Colocasia esculenta]|uniref:Uncharacterized protein n=1 Tax=Colocasia esculenta TaxID=4460 RepID=A0A843XHV0_COLES|nr:hypothetical protein [Colocasia esculenta]